MVTEPIEVDGSRPSPTLVSELNPYLQAFEKNLLLSLEIDIPGPSDISCQIALRLNVISNIEISLHCSER